MEIEQMLGSPVSERRGERKLVAQVWDLRREDKILYHICVLSTHGLIVKCVCVCVECSSDTYVVRSLRAEG